MLKIMRDITFIMNLCLHSNDRRHGRHAATSLASAFPPLNSTSWNETYAVTKVAAEQLRKIFEQCNQKIENNKMKEHLLDPCARRRVTRSQQKTSAEHRRQHAALVTQLPYYSLTPANPCHQHQPASSPGTQSRAYSAQIPAGTMPSNILPPH